VTKLRLGVEPWQKANPGRQPADRREVIPYLDPTIDQERLNEWLNAK